MVITSVFIVIRSIPGDPVTIMLGEGATQEAKASLREELGLNEPLYIQYFEWIKNILQGKFGQSIHSGEPVVNLLLQVAEPTVSIALVAIIVAFAIAIPAGIISAVRRYQWEDTVATFFSFLGISMPAFWIAILLVIAFVNVDFVPTYGYTSFREGIIPWLQHILLPGVAAGIPAGGILMRMTRSSMLEVLNENYIRTAHAKGISPRLVLFKHALQNGLISVATLAGIIFAGLLAGIIAVELVVGINGLGRLLINSVNKRDYPIVQACVIIISFVFVFMNLIIDLLYMAIDPQVKYGG